MQETTGSSTHKVNLSEYTDNTGRHSSHPAEQLEDYRRIRSKDGTTNTFDDKYQTTDAPNKAQQDMWKGETAFRLKKGTALPETQQQQFATETQPKSTEQKVTPQVIQYNPRTQLRTPPTTQDSAALHTTKGAAHIDFHILGWPQTIGEKY